MRLSDKEGGMKKQGRKENGACLAIVFAGNVHLLERGVIEREQTLANHAKLAKVG